MFKKYKLEILIAVLFVLTRLPGLGHDTFNTDVWKWKARSYDFGTGVFTGDFEKTIQKYHPGVTLMWIGTSAIKVYNLYSSYKPAVDSVQMIFQLHFVQKFFVVLAIAVSLSFCFYVLKKLFGTTKAVLLIMLLSFEPFYIALTREFHLEGLMSTFMFASFLWLYFYTQDSTIKKRLVISAIFAGLAFLTKTSALFMFLYAGLILLIEKKLQNLWLWVLVFLGTFVVLWPAMWTHPLTALSALYRGVSEIGIEREHIQFYFGKLVEDPGFFYYFVVLAFRSSYLLLPGLIGLAVFWKKIFAEHRKFLLYALLFIGFYFAQLIIPSKKLDRYILPNLMMLSVLSSFFWIWLADKNIFKIVVLAILAAIPALYLHPDYMSYYNPMFGGLRTGINVIEPKWIIGSGDIVKYFSGKEFTPVYGDTSLEKILSSTAPKNYLTVGFQEKYYTQIYPFFREIGGYAVIEDLTPFAEKTRYFVYPVWDDISGRETRFQLKYSGSIFTRGAETYRVYERVL